METCHGLRKRNETPMSKTKEPEILWVRLGEMGEYESFDQDLFAVWHCLKENGVQEITRVGAGIEASGKSYCQLYGRNYISLFWGDKDAQIIRELTDAELNEIRVIIMKRLSNPVKDSALRVERTLGGKEGYNYLKEVGPSEFQTALRDLLTDIRHFVAEKGLDLDKALEGSEEVFLEERE